MVALTRKIRAIILKLHTNILYQSRNFGIKFGQNRSNFLSFSEIEFGKDPLEFRFYEILKKKAFLLQVS